MSQQFASSHCDVILRRVVPPIKPYDRPMQPDDETFRARLREIVDRSGLSLRQASLAMGRDVGYVAALLSPSRPSRARPTPTDLINLSDETGIPFVELLERLWGVDFERLVLETMSRQTDGRVVK